MELPEHVTICEVGTRDGFQIEPDFVSTEAKIEVVNLLSDAGVPRIEVTSFVHPKVVPQMRDAEEVIAKIRRRPGTRYAALVPNDKGALRAVDAGVDTIHTVVSASESHNLANVNMTIAESIQKLAAVMRVAEQARIPVSCGISTSFGCPFEGDVPLSRLESVVRRLVDIGAPAVGLADTTGMANPRQVGRVVEHLMARFPGIEWTLHTHDTRAMAIPNILAAMACGVTHFDSPSAAWAGAPSRRAPRGTSAARTSSTASARWASRPGSISTSSSRSPGAFRRSWGGRCPVRSSRRARPRVVTRYPMASPRASPPARRP